MVSGTCRSGVSQLSSENAIGRGVKWIGAIAGAGRARAAIARVTRAAPEMQKVRRFIFPRKCLERRVLFADSLNLAFLPADIHGAPRGSISSHQIPVN